MVIPNILSLIIFIPVILGALPILFFKDDKLIKRWAILVSLIPLLLSILLWIGYNASTGGYQFPEAYAWIPTLNINYRLGVDGVSVPMIFLTTLLTVISLFYSAYVIDTRVKEYFALFLLLETGMLGVFGALDFFLFYIFWEIGLVPMYFLIGIWGHAEDRPQYSALKFFIYTLVGSVLMLLGILALYFQTNSFDMLAIAANKADLAKMNWLIKNLTFWGIFAAFAIKVPMWPFHTWLPDAHTAAPTAGSVILAGVLLKLGAYGFIRVLMPIFPDVMAVYAGLVIAVLAVIGIVYGAFVSMAQTDLKRLIAYSSVNHMGYAMLGIAAAALVPVGLKEYTDARAIALNGAVLQMFNHGIITGGLFLMVGMLYERAHTRQVDAFGGLAEKIPTYYGLMMLTSFASLGLPFLAGFVSEFMIFRGAFQIIPGITAIGVIGIVVTAAFILWKIIQMIFLGPVDEHKYEEMEHHLSPAVISAYWQPTDKGKRFFSTLSETQTSRIDAAIASLPANSRDVVRRFFVAMVEPSDRATLDRLNLTEGL